MEHTPTHCCAHSVGCSSATRCGVVTNPRPFAASAARLRKCGEFSVLDAAVLLSATLRRAESFAPERGAVRAGRSLLAVALTPPLACNE